MEVKLYVGNLSLNTEAQSINDTFSQAGAVTKVELPTDRETGQRRGFAYVTMGSREAANAAIEKLHGFLLDGRTIKVNEAQPSSGSGRDGGGRSRR